METAGNATKLCTKVSKKRKKEKKKKKRKGAEQPENFRPEDSGLPALTSRLVPPPLLPHLRLYLFRGRERMPSLVMGLKTHRGLDQDSHCRGVGAFQAHRRMPSKY